MKEDEIKEIFLAEALEGYEELNKLFTRLEKNPADKGAVDAIFRITHTLKANAAGMGYEDIAELAHVMEDVFSEIRSGKLIIDDKIFTDLFKANDVFGALLEKVRNIHAPAVKYKGLKTKLEVLLRTVRFGSDALPPEVQTKSKSADEVKAPAELPEEPIIAEEVETPAEDFSSPTPPPVTAVKPEKEAEPKPEQETITEAELIPEIEAEEEAVTEDEIQSKVTFSDLVQIPVRKLDALMNLVGELIIERDRITTLYSGNGSRNSEFSRLQRITADIQYSVMDVRLVQVNVLFNKFHRIVRDTAAIENKKVNLILEGTENEIDRNILQIISDSLIHLVRNSISHGIEAPDQRKLAGKSAEGHLTIRARSEKDAVIIEVEDDGKGIDHEVILRKALEKGIITGDFAKLMTRDEIIHLIFEPGFSSADKITEVSGRGVGMDVVKRSIDTIGGKIDVNTAVGEGTTVSLYLPTSMALKGALLFELDADTFAFPLSYTDAVIQIEKKDIHKVGKGLVAGYLNKTISVVFLSHLLSIVSETDLNADNFLQQPLTAVEDDRKLYVIVVSYGKRDVGFVVDRPLQQKEIVEKPLPPPLDQAKFISGATILGNGNVCLVLDVSSIVSTVFKLARK